MLKKTWSVVGVVGLGAVAFTAFQNFTPSTQSSVARSRASGRSVSDPISRLVEEIAQSQKLSPELKSQAIADVNALRGRKEFALALSADTPPELQHHKPHDTSFIQKLKDFSAKRTAQLQALATTSLDVKVHYGLLTAPTAEKLKAQMLNYGASSNLKSAPLSKSSTNSQVGTNDDLDDIFDGTTKAVIATPVINAMERIALSGPKLRSVSKKIVRVSIFISATVCAKQLGEKPVLTTSPSPPGLPVLETLVQRHSKPGKNM